MATEKLLTEGLQAGFAGGSTRAGVDRAGFPFESSDYTSPEGARHHDEWSTNRVGAGQEITDENNIRYSRVYAGGTISEENLQQLGITKKQVIGELKKIILEHGDKIRLFDNFEFTDGPWKYEHIVLDHEPEIPVTITKESIHYNGNLVFVHGFIHCPVE